MSTTYTKVTDMLAGMLRQVIDDYGLDFEPLGCLCIKVSKFDTDALENETLKDKRCSPKFAETIRQNGIRSLTHLLGNYPVTWDAEKTETFVYDIVDVAHVFEL